MPLYRFYIDKQIVDGVGGEHSRVFDVGATSEMEARGSLVLEPDEVENSVVELYEGGSAPALTGEALRDFYIRQLEDLGYDVPNELKIAVVNP